MSTKKDAAQDVAETKHLDTIEIYGPENEMVKVTVEQLEKLAEVMGRVIEINVFGERNLNKGNFENEKFGQGAKLNFQWYWDLIPPDQMRGDSAALIQKCFANGAMRAIGLAYRDIYVNHVFSVGSRARQLKLPQQAIITAELKALRSPETYDPFGVVEKEAQ